MRFKQKGQGALEYLILIGAAILVAVIVVSVVLGTSTSGRQSSEETTRSYQELVTNTIIPPTIISVTCIDDKNATYVINPSVTKGVTEYCVVVNGDVNIDNCVEPTSNNKVLITNISPALTSKTKYNMSLVAKKGNAYSAPTLPAPDCIVP
ncbi:MAG TPA: class III signal peptide-containing protein [archaeon]|nr:class III signal peptide-containing protein [archaeon]HPV66080.1 class III signal peptide-containing protein [archaeon]